MSFVKFNYFPWTYVNKIFNCLTTFWPTVLFFQQNFEKDLLLFDLSMVFGNFVLKNALVVWVKLKSDQTGIGENQGNNTMESSPVRNGNKHLSYMCNWTMYFETGKNSLLVVTCFSLIYLVCKQEHTKQIREVGCVTVTSRLRHSFFCAFL